MIALTTTKRAPDFRGAGDWCAWRSRMKPLGQRGRPDWDATLEGYLLFCPGAHICWSYWWIALVHLRPIEGVKPAIIAAPGNGWEVICGAQDPNVAPDADDSATASFLDPIDWVVQFGDVKTDHDARRVVVACVIAIMSGRVSPDQDFRAFWNRTVPDTAKCMSEGGHPQQ